MKNLRAIITCTLTVLALSAFFATEVALAECKAGKVEVVIITPSGKEKTICVSENALAGFENAAEHSETTFEVACPCFTQEQVERIDGYRDDNQSNLTYECTLETNWAMISEVDNDGPLDWMQYAIMDKEQMRCNYYLEIDGEVIEENIIYGLTTEEADACYIIIEEVCTAQ